MAAIQYTVQRIAEMAEASGFRAWFDFATCHIHRMKGADEVARFSLDDQQDFWVGSEFLLKIISDGKYNEIMGHINVLLFNSGEQLRDGLYMLQDQALSWWNIKELPDGTGTTTVARNSRDAMYTKRGVERLRRRYDVTSRCIAVEIKSETPKTGRDDSGAGSGQNNQGGGNNNYNYF
jgi:hypothetical protein